MSKQVITIPYNFTPRPYQRDVFKAMDSGIKRLILMYHRRAGKDKTCFNVVVKKALERRGAYYYFFPEFAQGRRIIWDGVDSSGYPFLEHIPEPLIQNKNGTDMKITLANGSIIQIMGTDKFNKVRGANPVGCVFSEFAFQNPKAWNIVRPILAENNGWAIFNSTKNGKNHLYDLVQMAKDRPSWFIQDLSVIDTVDENGNRYISDEVIEEERLSGMSEELIQQEFYNSWTANSNGFYYLAAIEDLDKQGKIGRYPFDPKRPVETYWDIGVGGRESTGDYTAIWFCQIIDKEINIIDYYCNTNRGMDHYAKILKDKPYVYSSHNFPHDIENTEFGTGRTRYEVAEELFIGTRLNIVPKLGKAEGVNAVRMVLPLCTFNYSTTKEGIDGLKNYRKKWDDKNQVFLETPVHDWASDPADAFRYLAVGITMPKDKNARKGYAALTAGKKLQIKNWRVA